jgi:hypothetical protein
MSRRFFELAVRARRLVTRTTHPTSRAPRPTRLTARRQLGNELTQFSFRLAFVIDIAYVGIGGLAGAAVARASNSVAPSSSSVLACADRVRPTPNAPPRDQPPSPILPPGVIR